MTTNEIRSLTPLRGVAAVGVMLLHYCGHLGFRDQSVEYTFVIKNLYYLVELFLILSGFVLAAIYGSRFVDGTASYIRFLRARFARIYPLHIAILAILLVLVIENPQLIRFGGLTLAGAGGTAILVQIWTHNAWNYPTWSIAAEAHLYVAFPIMAVLVLGRGREALRLALGVATIVALLVVQNAVYGTFEIMYGLGVVPRVTAAFLAGIVLFRIHERGWLEGALSVRGSFLVAVAVLVVMLHLDANGAAILASMALVVMTAVYDRSIATVLLNSQPLTLLGNWSYSIYLLHIPVFYVAHVFVNTPELAPTHAVMMMIVCAALTITAAELTYRWVEMPARRFLRP